MKAPPFEYVRAKALADVFQLWAEAGPEARLLAGGQSLIATLALRLSEPSTLIDITRVPELRGIELSGDTLRLGALTTHAELAADALVRQHAPLLAEAAPLIAHPAIRNRGTLGGSLAFADPAAELPACAVALGATIVAVSAAGERRIPARTFFQGLYATALATNELIVAVEVPLAKAGERSTILELARRSGDYAMAGIVARARLDTGRLADPQIAFFALGDGPVMARGAMAALADRVPDRAAIAAAAAALAGDLDPPADLNGGSDMKRHLACVLLARAIERLARGKEARAA
ncbi:MAG TPA: xanthine dehydrogenase family protein subunit M [Hyphomicrobiaceae bacterium]|jgi:carbon-monoxide dehydrogenase medium subunit|nr:xanthine dehydrogenase family protein subunit M [Hyphomicrobiaceae bacterium]